MRCDEFAALLESWLDGEAAAGAAIEAHQADCESCAALADARRAERKALRDLLEFAPPAGLREEILERAEGERTGKIVRLRIVRGKGRAWTLAAAVLLLALGLASLLDPNDGSLPRLTGGPVIVYLDGGWEVGGGIFEAGTLELPAAPGHLSADELSAEGGSR